MILFLKCSILCGLLLATIGISSVSACTGIKLIAKDGSNVHGRTLEFGIDLDTSAVVIPRNYKFTGTSTTGKGLEYTSKYGVVGAIVFDKLAILDGINEKGLSIGTFFFPGFADYAKITAENESKALSPSEFPNWVITQFATIDEVKAALNDVVISPTVEKGWGNAPAPFHYIVFDKSGSALVIEPLDGKLVTYDDKLGVLTNSPTFDWHQLNLRNYINLRAVNVPPLKADGMTLAPFGQGSGLVGLPGDFTPPSRFVRAATFTFTAIPSENAEKAIFQVFHILNNFDIPVGSTREVDNGVIHTDFTMLTCARDPQALKYYFKSYADQTIRVIDLKSFDLNAKNVKKAPTTSEQPVVNVSADLK